MILSLCHTLLSLISEQLQWGKIGRCIKHRIISVRSVFKPEVTNPTLHGMLSAQHPTPVNPCCLLPCVEGFTLVSSDCSLAQAELWAVTWPGLFRAHFCHPPILVSFAKNTEFLQLHQQARQSSQAAHKGAPGFLSLGCWGWKGRFVKKPSRNPGGERRGLELATVNEKHNSNADMYFTKLFAQLHGKERHQLQFKVEKGEMKKKLRYSITQELFPRLPSRNRLPSFHSIRYCYNKITSWALMVS